MPVAICSGCGKYVPDSFHDWNMNQICSCKTKNEWIAYYKRHKWSLRIDGERYDFTEVKKK